MKYISKYIFTVFYDYKFNFKNIAIYIKYLIVFLLYQKLQNDIVTCPGNQLNLSNQ